jgi:hypothetical protein
MRIVSIIFLFIQSCGGGNSTPDPGIVNVPFQARIFIAEKGTNLKISGDRGDE